MLPRQSPRCSNVRLTAAGHETVGVVAAVGSKVKGFEIGERVVADNSELCGECFYCRRGDELFCEHFEAHGVTMNGGFAEYCAYPGMLYNLDQPQYLATNHTGL